MCNEDVMYVNVLVMTILVGGFRYVLFSSLFGEDSHFDEHIFQMGWFNHQPATIGELAHSYSRGLIFAYKSSGKIH